MAFHSGSGKPLGANDFLDIFFDYLQNGVIPGKEVGDYVIRCLPNTHPSLHPLNRAFALETSKLTKEPCLIKRNVILNDVLEILLSLMKKTDIQNVKDTVPTFQSIHSVVMTNLQMHDKSVEAALESFLIYIKTFITSKPFDLENLVRSLRHNFRLFSLDILPLFQAMLNMVTANPEEPCRVRRLHIATTIMDTILATMSTINDNIVRKFFPRFQEFHQHLVELQRICREDFDRMMILFCQKLSNYTGVTPFDMDFLDIMRIFSISEECAVAHRPLVSLMITTLQELPAMVSWLQRENYVADKLREIIAFVNAMPNSVPENIAHLENLLRTIVRSRNELFFFLLGMRALIQQ
jgi:hypothetical protein